MEFIHTCRQKSLIYIKINRSLKEFLKKTVIFEMVTHIASRGATCPLRDKSVGKTLRWRMREERLRAER